MLTDEQQFLSSQIASSIPSSGRACAGTGKTTTAVSGLQNVTGNVLALAFNKSAAENLKKRITNPSVQSKTLNGLGHGMVMKMLNRGVTLEESKIRQCVKAVTNGNLPPDDFVIVENLTKAARIAGIVPQGITWLDGLLPDDAELIWPDLISDDPEDIHVEYARRALKLSCDQVLNGVIDFDDQIYISALNGNVHRGFTQIVVDEAQDLNPLQHRMLTKFSGAKICIIGDPRQSIYGFRGAVTSSMEKLEEKFNLSLAPLTLCFRCDQEIVKEAQQWCPEIRAASEEQGLVDNLEQWQTSTFGPQSAILCRNNAPLLALAFKMIRDGQRPNFVGRDIGKNLIQTVRKAIGQTPGQYLADVERRLDAYFARQIQLADAKGRLSKVEQLTDRRECIQAVIENCTALDSTGLLAEMQQFFSAPGSGVTLSSVHRAKGLEWPTVYWLDSHLGYRKGQSAEQHQQEQNLKYVAATRAQHQLFYIQSEGEQE